MTWVSDFGFHRHEPKRTNLPQYRCQPTQNIHEMQCGAPEAVDQTDSCRRQAGHIRRQAREHRYSDSQSLSLFMAKEWCDGVAVASALATSPWHRSLATPQTDDFSHCGSSPESWAQTLRHSGGTSTLVRANSNTVRTARGTGSGNGSHGVFVVA